MKRTIQINAGRITVTARINTNGLLLNRNEVERVRDALADALQDAVTQVPYLVGVPRNRVKVR